MNYSTCIYLFSADSLSNLLSDIMSLLISTPDHPDTSANEAMNAVTLISWISKALVMRAHKNMNDWTHNLVHLLSHKSVGSKAADGFRLIMIQEEEYMNEHNYCNIRLVNLYNNKNNAINDFTGNSCSSLSSLTYKLNESSKIGKVTNRGKNKESTDLPQTAFFSHFTKASMGPKCLDHTFL